MVTSGEVAARVGTEMLDRPLALRAGARAAQVRLDPRLSEPFAGAEGELRHRAGLHAEERSHLLGLHLLDLGVPEHLLPTRREAAEGLRGEAAVEGLVRSVLGAVRVGDRVELVDGGLAACASPRGGGVADAGEEVGAERAVGAAALEDRLVDAGIGLLHQVVRIDRGCHRSRDGHSGGVVPPPEFPERPLVAGADAEDQIGIADGLVWCGVLSVHGHPSGPGAHSRPQEERREKASFITRSLHCLAKSAWWPAPVRTRRRCSGGLRDARRGPPEKFSELFSENRVMNRAPLRLIP